MLLSLSLTIITLPYVTGQQSQGHIGPPGMPDDALQFNHSDVTPVRRREQITANKTHVFFYRNVTLMMNCSRNFELNLTIDSRVRTRYFSLIMEANRSMMLYMNISVSPPPGVMVMERSLNFYSEMESNVTIQLRARLRLYINETALNMELNRLVNRSRLIWMYWNRTGLGWVPVESYIDEDGYLVCNTTSFSTWTVVEMVPLQVTGSLSKDEVTFGETVTVSATVKDEEGNAVEGATVQATVEDTTISLSDQGGGNYTGTLDTGKLAAGATYDIIVTAHKEGFLGQRTLILHVQAQPIPWITYVMIGLIAVAVAMISAVILMRRR